MLILKPENIVYYGGLFMIMFSGFLLIKLRFIYATIAGWSIVLFYFFGFLIINSIMTQTLLFGTLFFIGALVIGMVGAYNIEKMNRKQFLYSISITKMNASLTLQFEEKNEQVVRLEKSIKENEILHQINLEKDLLTQSLKESDNTDADGVCTSRNDF